MQCAEDDLDDEDREQRKQVRTSIAIPCIAPRTPASNLTRVIHYTYASACAGHKPSPLDNQVPNMPEIWYAGRFAT